MCTLKEIPEIVLDLGFWDTSFLAWYHSGPLEALSGVVHVFGFRPEEVTQT